MSHVSWFGFIESINHPVELNKEEPSSQARCQYLKEEYSKVKKYFQEEKDQAIMERILEVKDDWSDLLSIRNEIEEKQLFLFRFSGFEM